MTRNHELELVTCAAHSLQKALEAARASDAHLANAQQTLAILLTLYESSVPVPASGRHVRIAIAAGRRLRDEDLHRLAEEDYDVLRDTTNSILKYREDPEQHRKLR